MFPARRLAHTGLVGLAALFCLVGQAQQVFRIVGPDGRVTFSDKPPPDAKATPAPSVAMPGGGGGGGAAMPRDLQPIVSKYPVTLYSAKECGPCVAGRAYLTSRGVPFSERTIESNDD